ncbi:rab GTPase-activating protein 1-like isoform X2 [Coccinella septempunctata]|uniref:rab GTPase-activating protein 1-like isoform X2 n=1 Tax=Coccinella septempunctata TaxID=41139 RepID=UPI001D07FABD|nr:rab GTPase-activating protein 1-like isoform X2 [Coccinella septempunctata]
MEDNLSVKSNESIATSEEFDFVTDKPGISKTPTLDIKNGDLTQLKDALTEVLLEANMDDECDSNSTTKLVGQSKFYGYPVQPGDDPLTGEINLSPTEKQDPMKPGSSEEDVSDIDQDCTIFSGVTYLGAATINAPKSEAEIQRNMAILNEQSVDLGIKVAVSVPSSSQGVVVLYDATSNSVISRYEIHRILFYARGPAGTPEQGCFAFTWSHGETQESAIFQCHVFRCDIAEAVARVSARKMKVQSSIPACFAKAFQRVSRSMSSSITSAADMTGSITTLPEARTLMYVFEVNLEIKEEDGKGGYCTVGKDKHGFKLKTNSSKQLCLTIKQVSDNGPQLLIERCFGVLIASGRHVRHSDMQLLEMREKTTTSLSLDKNCTQICAIWDPTEANFESLNAETPKDVKQFMTVAVDLVIRGIQEPVRFQIETKVRVYGQNERNFWYFQRKNLTQQFFLNLKEVLSVEDVYYEVLSMETSGELDRNLLNLNLNLTSLIQSPSINSIDTITPKEEYFSDGDEPLLSGTGMVSKDCSEDVLDNWAEVLSQWKSTKKRPKQLTALVKLGIPEALRGEVWQRLAGIEENTEMMDNYRVLITKDSNCENVIQSDIARTFPAHDFFKEVGGLGQDSLYRVSKAYAGYDLEVGYCQGLSFLAATLLLHMPEEQAFCVLVKLMYDYGLRDLYKDGFDNLYLRLYQLNRLMEEQLPSLSQHFAEHSVETHMFASQWFLTLFTARFPLYFVFHIIDVFLLQGIDTIFQIALALLMLCKKDLLQLDFEGILKYIRVSLPKKCRTEESAKQLIKLACNIKLKKLRKYESDFNDLKEQANNAEEANELEQIKTIMNNQEEEIKLLRDEIDQLKGMLKREINQAENDKKTNLTIIQDYEVTRRQMDTKLQAMKKELEILKSKMSQCDKCLQHIEPLDKKIEYIMASGDQITHDDKARDRIRELELELAQTKLARVEAECKNQDLTHQLRAAELDLTTTKNNWPPWLSKTLTSIKEAAKQKEFPSFNYPSNYPNLSQNPSFVSHVGTVKRDSLPRDHTTISKERPKESPPLLKDSQSCSSLKSHN